MAYTKYSLTPANNNATPPDGAPEGMLPSAVNDTMRDMMAQIRDVGDGIRDGTYTMTAAKITGGTITGVAFTGNTFTSPVISGGSINNTPIGASTANTGAFTTLSASGVATFSAGTVSAPAITTSGDTNTGIFFPAADTIAFTEGGVEAMRINSSANVGIGTTNPTSRLYVEGTIQARSGGSGVLLYGDGGSDAFVSGVGTNNLAFITNSSERMRIDSSGNVGIGTSSPGSILTVAASDTNNVVGGSVAAINITNTNETAYGRTTNIIFSSGSATQAANKIAAIGSVYTSFNTSRAGALTFSTSNDTGTFAERMRIREDGAVLIGTTTSLATLTVNGNISPVQAPSSNWGIDFTPSSSSGTYITIANDATYDIAFGSGYVYIYEDAGNGIAEIACYYGITNIRFQSAALYNVAENNAGTLNVFYKASVARYRIQNKTGSSKVIYLSTFRFRNAV